MSAVVPLRPPETPASTVGRTDEGEAVFSNRLCGEAALTLCVPCYRDSADPLITSLTRMAEASRATLLLYDDGTGDDDMTRRMARHVMAFPAPARLVTAPANRGRAHARNRLVAMAETDWVLFLDADMCPDADYFLQRYLDAVRKAEGPALIVGGFSLQQVLPTRETALHAAQSTRSECLTAAERQTAPGRYVFTSNLLVHKDILRAVPFDDGYTGWGWEDVDWGLSVAKRFPVLHIDNPATHLGLDTTEALMQKFGKSGANFARLADRHSEAVHQMPLWRHARRLKRLPGRKYLTALAASAARNTHLPLAQRVFALKLYRALNYAEHIQ